MEPARQIVDGMMDLSKQIEDGELVEEIGKLVDGVIEDHRNGSQMDMVLAIDSAAQESSYVHTPLLMATVVRLCRKEKHLKLLKALASEVLQSLVLQELMQRDEYQKAR